MLFIAVPTSFIGFGVILLSTHSGGIFLLFGKLLVPAFFFESFFIHNGSNVFWYFTGIVQFILWSLIAGIYFLFRQGRHHE